MYKKIVITGANSFLGTNVILELCKRGIQCHALVRHSNHTLESVSAKIFHGNPAVYHDMLIATTGCDCIVHIAAITDQSLLHYSDYSAFNVGTVKNVVAVARQCGIKRVIYVSSANTIGNGTALEPGDESTPVTPPFSDQLYARSKIEAEQVLRAATDIDSVILNPTFMLGPYDSKPSSGQIIMMGYHRRLVFATPGGKNIVSVQAVATALCNAIECGRACENYLLSGVDISIADFFRLLARVTNFRSLVIVVPRPFLIIAGYAGDLLRACRIRTQVCSTNMRVVCEKEYYRADKAHRELSLPETSAEQSIASAVDWFRANHML